MLYIYHTGGRDDGMDFCVGDYPDGGPVNGCRALFQSAQDAHRFAFAVQDDTDCDVHILPTAEVKA